MAYIISGVKKKSKVVIGKASIRIPFFERLDKLNLRLIPIDVKTSNAVPTADYININVDATVNVKISNDPEKLRLAAENFLNKNTEYIASVAREVLEGNVREIVGKMRLEEMVSDRQKFANLVKENAEPDLAAMGLDIISFNVQNFVDGNDVIENLGIDNIVKIKKSAAIAKAESERDIKVAQAAADKESNDAAVEAQTEIAKKQNELAIKKSELQMEADTKKAMADAAYEIQKEEQRKTIEVTTANADIAKQEREIELKQKQVAVTEQSLEAEVKKKAEAEKYAAQQRAESIARGNAVLEQISAGVERQHRRTLVVNHAATEQPALAALHRKRVGVPTGASGNHVHVADSRELLVAATRDIGDSHIAPVVARLIAELLRNAERAIERVTDRAAKRRTGLRIGSNGHGRIAHQLFDIGNDILPDLVDILGNALLHLIHERPPYQ